MLAKLKKFLFSKISGFLVENEDVIGIDITPVSIKILQLNKQKNDISWTLEKIHFSQIEKITSEEKEDQKENIVKHLKTLIEKNKIKTTNVALSIPVENAIIKVVSIPIMSPQEMEKAIEYDSLWDNLIQLPSDSSEYSIFHNVIQKNTDTNMMDILVVASKIDEINYYTEIISAANLNPVIVDVQVFAIKYAININTPAIDINKPRATLYIEKNNSYIAIYNGETPYIIDIFISDSEYNTIIDADENIEAVSRRLAFQFDQIINSYINKLNIDSLDTIFLVSKIPSKQNFAEQLNQFLSEDKQVTEFNPFKSLIIPENLKEKVESIEQKNMFTTAIGLSTRRFDVFGYYQYVKGTQNVNLLPNADRLKNVNLLPIFIIYRLKNAKKTKLYSKIAFLALIVIFLFLGIFSFSSSNQEESKLDTQLSNYESLRVEFDQKNQKIAKLEQQQQQLNMILENGTSLKSNKQLLYEVFDFITKSIPKGVWLTSITFKNEVQIVINGKSQNDQTILKLIDQLAVSKLIEKVSLASMNLSQNNENGSSMTEVKNFQLNCYLNTMRESK